MLVNQIITSVNPKRPEVKYRIVAEEKDEIAASDLSCNRPRRPFTINIEYFDQKVKRKEWVLLPPDLPDILFEDDSYFKQKLLAKKLKLLKKNAANDEVKDPLAMRDAAWSTIKPLVKDPEKLHRYLFGDPKGLLQELIELSQRNKKYVTSMLNRYFRDGGIKNALLPNYFNCGQNFSLPKSPKLNEAGLYDLSSKPGPETVNGNAYRHVTQKDVQDIEQFARSHLRNRKEVVLEDLYEDYIYRYGSVSIRPKGATIEEMIEELRVPLGNNHVISSRAFKRQINKVVSKLTWLRKRVGEKNYTRDHKARTGSAKHGLRGATSRYEIDSTILDSYVRYEFSNELMSIGRPILYLVIDVVTGMIVGMHIAFHGPDWTGACHALLNACSDKVEFCKQFGVKISSEDWPCSHPPRELTADRGTENSDKNMEALLKGKIGIEVVNLNAYHMGVCKGTVEKSFDIIQKKAFSPLEHGKVIKINKFDEQHPSRNNVLTSDELTRAIIKCVLHANNHSTRINNRTYEMERDGVAFAPRDAWNYSLSNCVIAPAQLPREQLLFGLLPEAKVSVRSQGVYFKGLYYSSTDFERLPLLELSKNFCRQSISIRYSESSTNHIWYKDEETKTVYQLELTERSEAYKNMVWEQIHHRMVILKSQLAVAEEQSRISSVILRSDLRTLERMAKTRTNQHQKSQAKGIVSDIKENRKTESDRQHHQYQQDIAKSMQGAVKDIAQNDLVSSSSDMFGNPNAVEVTHG
ncbi:transposase [Alteromonas marina]|nr:transposase [Tenacibaculum sp. KUL113]